VSNDREVIENVDFQYFRTLRLGTLGNKAKINYDIVLFSPLLPFH